MCRGIHSTQESRLWRKIEPSTNVCVSLRLLLLVALKCLSIHLIAWESEERDRSRDRSRRLSPDSRRLSPDERSRDRICLDLQSDRFFDRESASDHEPETDPEWRIGLGLGGGHCEVHTFGQMTDADRIFRRSDLSQSKRWRLTHWWFG